MNKKRAVDRRGFLVNSALGLGAVGGSSLIAEGAAPNASSDRANRLPREVWTASLSLDGLEANSPDEMIRKVFQRLEEIAPLEPDIVCLPEVFPFLKVSGSPPLAQIAEVPLGPISGQLAAWAKAHRSYVVCPIYTQEKGRYYNSAVLIDRDGNYMGEYRKTHATEGEMELGVSPGPLDPPVFKTDFGTIGVQICFDINWYDGWRRLHDLGAEMVFWPSAFCGGKMLNAMAWMNKYYVISSTRHDPTKICDISGDEIASTSRFKHWVCAPLNLERVLIHGWPYCKKYDAVQQKYGRKISIQSLNEEGWGIIESHSADVKVRDVLDEFEIKIHEGHIHSAEVKQDRNRE